MLFSRTIKSLREHGLLWLWVWLILVAGQFYSNQELLGTPAHEEGDDAANALSIERAKYFRELHGNYSRFQFHHPGPAFFSTYAMGEWVLLDGLKAVPARHNAHILAGALLQTLFLAGAIGMLARRATRPGLAALVLTAVCTLHFAFVPGAVVAIWPPQVLMGPIACFLVACATVAAGAGASWFWLCLSAGYLLHGHVAQPMFIAGLALTAFYLASRRAQAEGQGRWAWLPRGKAAIVAGTVVFFFALPLLIDLTAGRESNINHILLQLRYGNAKTRPEWIDAIPYTLSYFGYCVTQENWWFNKAAGTPLQFLREHGIPLAGWLILTIVLAAWFRRKKTATGPRVYFLRGYAVLLAVMMVLSLLWAKRQDDGITYFNSYFLFGFMFAILGLAVLVAFESLFKGENDAGVGAEAPAKPSTGSWKCWLLAALSIAGIAWGTPRIRSIELFYNARANAVASQVPRVIAADRWAKAPKLLVFDQDSWYESVTVAATLQRAGITFKMPEYWEFMFGREHALLDPKGASRPDAYSWWRVEVPTEKNNGPDVVGLNKEGQVKLLSKAPALGTLPTTLRFAGKGSQRIYFPLGCDAAEQDFAWTLGSLMVFRASAEPAAGDIELQLTAGGLLGNKVPSQRVFLWVDGERLGMNKVIDKDVFTWRIPRTLWNRQLSRCGTVQCAFELPDARVPALIGKSGDRRKLALQLYEMRIIPLPDEKAPDGAATAQPKPGQP